MIVGNEMQNIQSRALRAIRREIQNQSVGDGDLLWACKESLRVGTHYYVYNVGNAPTRYGRRYEGGGLADEDNWVITTLNTPRGAIIDIEDQTPAGDAGMINPPPDPVFYLSDIIEAGANGPKWKDPDWPGPRPYMEHAMQDGCHRGGLIDFTLNNVVANTDLSGV